MHPVKTHLAHLMRTTDLLRELEEERFDLVIALPVIKFAVILGLTNYFGSNLVIAKSDKTAMA
jgi:hypothetical protein